MAKVTIIDVAREAGVSTATVSRVLNGNAAVDGKLSEKVFEAVRRLGYIPDATARSLRRPDVSNIAILIPTVFFSDILRGAVDESFERNCKLISYASNGDAKREIECLERIALSGVNGLIYCPTTTEGMNALSVIMKQGIRVVIAARHGVAEGLTHVFTDHVSACYKATKYLLQLNRRKIAFFAGFWEDRPRNVDMLLGMRGSMRRGTYSTLDRLVGYELALREFGLELDPRLIFLTGFEYENGYTACKKALASLCEFDSVICPTDRCAGGTLQALQEQNIRVPNQVSLIGYDDGVYAMSMRPTLTAVHQSSYQIGRQSVASLVSIISGGDTADIEFDAELMVRESTAARTE